MNLPSWFHSFLFLFFCSFSKAKKLHVDFRVRALVGTTLLCWEGIQSKHSLQSHTNNQKNNIKRKETNKTPKILYKFTKKWLLPVLVTAVLL